MSVDAIPKYSFSSCRRRSLRLEGTRREHCRPSFELSSKVIKVAMRCRNNCKQDAKRDLGTDKCFPLVQIAQISRNWFASCATSVNCYYHNVTKIRIASRFIIVLLKYNRIIKEICFLFLRWHQMYKVIQEISASKKLCNLLVQF